MTDHAPLPSASRLWEATKLHLRRAARCDFSREHATEAERQALASAALPVTAPHVQDYLAWRRSMGWVALVPMSVVVLLSLIGFVRTYGEDATNLLRMLTFGMFLTKVALWVGLFTLVRRWREGDATRRRLWLGWLVHFLGPVLLCLVPIMAAVDLPAEVQGPVPEIGPVLERLNSGTATGQDVQTLRLWGHRMFLEAFRVWVGLAILLNLAPTFLAIFPALTRAGFTVKTLLPGRSGAAAVAGMMAPIYASGFLVAGVSLQQIGGSILLALGLLVFLCGPLAIARRAADLTSPMSREQAGAAVRAVRKRAAAFVTVGGGLLVISLFFIEIMSMRLFGFGDRVMMGPSDLLEILLNFTANLTALTVVASDWLVRGMRLADRMALSNAASAEFQKDGPRLDEVATALESRPRAPAAAPLP